MVDYLKIIASAVASTGIFQHANSSDPHYIDVPNLPDNQLKDWAISEASKIFDSDKTKCEKCLSGINLGKYVTLKSPGVTPEAMEALCEKYKYSDYCAQYQGKDPSKFNMGKHISQVFTLMDAFGQDGRAMCAWKVGGCSYNVPTPDISSWLGEKPDNPKGAQIKSEGKTFNALHISDFHLDLRYQVGQESYCDVYMCCTEQSHNPKNEAAGFTQKVMPAQSLGSYHCDAPTSLVDESMKSVGVLNGKHDFEFGIFTGDMVSHDLKPFLGYDKTWQSEDVCYSTMKKYLGNMPVYPTFGNHDSFPYGQIAQNRSGFASQFSWNAELSAELWNDYGWIDQDTQEMASHTYGSFAVTTKRGLRVISIDSNFWYADNYYNFWGVLEPDTSGIWKWLVDELLQCEKNGQKAWLMSHVPAQDEISVPWITSMLKDIIVRFSPHVIASTFWGHTHADEFNVFYKDFGQWSEHNAVAVGWIAQSITPIDLYNPSWRYYEVDTQTFEIMDSRNYYTKLNETYDVVIGDVVNKTTQNGYTHKTYKPHTPGQLNWEFEYSARDSYDPENSWPKEAPLNATFWHRVARNVYENEDQNKLYRRHYYRNSPYTSFCTGKCKKRQYCGMVAGSTAEKSHCNGLKDLPGLKN